MVDCSVPKADHPKFGERFDTQINIRTYDSLGEIDMLVKFNTRVSVCNEKNDFCEKLTFGGHSAKYVHPYVQNTRLFT